MPQFLNVLDLLNAKNWKSHHKNRGRISNLNRIAKQLFKAHYNDQHNKAVSHHFAIALKRHVRSTFKTRRRTPAFVEEIRRTLLFLHEYNLRVAKVKLTNKYPMSRHFNNLLVQYIELECEALYSQKCPVNRHAEREVAQRVLRLLHVILYDAIHCSEVDPDLETTTKTCFKIMLKLVTGVRADCNCENRVASDLIMLLIDKMDINAEINKLKGRNIPFYLDTHLIDPDVLKVRQNLTITGYESDGSDSDNEESVLSNQVNPLGFLNQRGPAIGHKTKQELNSDKMSCTKSTIQSKILGFPAWGESESKSFFRQSNVTDTINDENILAVIDLSDDDDLFKPQGADAEPFPHKPMQLLSQEEIKTEKNDDARVPDYSNENSNGNSDNYSETSNNNNNNNGTQDLDGAMSKDSSTYFEGFRRNCLNSKLLESSIHKDAPKNGDSSTVVAPEVVHFPIDTSTEKLQEIQTVSESDAVEISESPRTNKVVIQKERVFQTIQSEKRSSQIIHDESNAVEKVQSAEPTTSAASVAEARKELAEQIVDTSVDEDAHIDEDALLASEPEDLDDVQKHSSVDLTKEETEQTLRDPGESSQVVSTVDLTVEPPTQHSEEQTINSTDEITVTQESVENTLHVESSEKVEASNKCDYQIFQEQSADAPDDANAVVQCINKADQSVALGHAEAQQIQSEAKATHKEHLSVSFEERICCEVLDELIDEIVTSESFSSAYYSADYSRVEATEEPEVELHWGQVFDDQMINQYTEERVQTARVDSVPEAISSAIPIEENVPAEEFCEQPAAEKSPVAESTAEHLVVEESKIEELEAEESYAEQHYYTFTTEQPIVESLAVEEPSVEHLIQGSSEPTVELVEQCTAEQFTVQEHVEQLAIEEHLLEDSTLERSTIEELPAEEHVESLTVEKFAVEQLSIQQHIVEQPSIEQPIVEGLAVEDPIVVQPNVEDCRTVESTIECHAAEESAVKDIEPIVEQHMFVESTLERSTIEELPAEEYAEQLSIQEHTVERFNIKEPIVDQPTVEDPIVAQSTVEDHMIVESAIEGHTIEELTVEEHCEQLAIEERVEQPAVEDLTVKHFPVENPIIPQHIVEEHVIVEHSVDEPTIEKTAIEEPPTLEAVPEKITGKEDIPEETTDEVALVEEATIKEVAIEEAAIEEATVEEAAIECLVEDHSVKKAVYNIVTRQGRKRYASTGNSPCINEEVVAIEQVNEENKERLQSQHSTLVDRLGNVNLEDQILESRTEELEDVGANVPNFEHEFAIGHEERKTEEVIDYKNLTPKQIPVKNESTESKADEEKPASETETTILNLIEAERKKLQINTSSRVGDKVVDGKTVEAFTADDALPTEETSLEKDSEKAEFPFKEQPKEYPSVIEPPPADQVVFEVDPTGLDKKDNALLTLADVAAMRKNLDVDSNVESNLKKEMLATPRRRTKYGNCPTKTLPHRNARDNNRYFSWTRQGKRTKQATKNTKNSIKKTEPHDFTSTIISPRANNVYNQKPMMESETPSDDSNDSCDSSSMCIDEGVLHQSRNFERDIDEEEPCVLQPAPGGACISIPEHVGVSCNSSAKFLEELEEFTDSHPINQFACIDYANAKNDRIYHVEANNEGPIEPGLGPFGKTDHSIETILNKAPPLVRDTISLTIEAVVRGETAEPTNNREPSNKQFKSKAARKYYSERVPYVRMTRMGKDGNAELNGDIDFQDDVAAETEILHEVVVNSCEESREPLDLSLLSGNKNYETNTQNVDSSRTALRKSTRIKLRHEHSLKPEISEVVREEIPVPDANSSADSVDIGKNIDEISKAEETCSISESVKSQKRTRSSGKPKKIGLEQTINILKERLEKPKEVLIDTEILLKPSEDASGTDKKSRTRSKSGPFDKRTKSICPEECDAVATDTRSRRRRKIELVEVITSKYNWSEDSEASGSDSKNRRRRGASNELSVKDDQAQPNKLLETQIESGGKSKVRSKSVDEKTNSKRSGIEMTEAKENNTDSTKKKETRRRRSTSCKLDDVNFNPVSVECASRSTDRIMTRRCSRSSAVDTLETNDDDVDLETRSKSKSSDDNNYGVEKDDDDIDLKTRFESKKSDDKSGGVEKTNAIDVAKTMEKQKPKKNIKPIEESFDKKENIEKSIIIETSKMDEKKDTKTVHKSKSNDNKHSGVEETNAVQTTTATQAEKQQLKKHKKPKVESADRTEQNEKSNIESLKKIEEKAKSKSIKNTKKAIEVVKEKESLAKITEKSTSNKEKHSKDKSKLLKNEEKFEKNSEAGRGKSPRRPNLRELYGFKPRKSDENQKVTVNAPEKVENVDKAKISGEPFNILQPDSVKERKLEIEVIKERKSSEHSKKFESNRIETNDKKRRRRSLSPSNSKQSEKKQRRSDSENDRSRSLDKSHRQEDKEKRKRDHSEPNGRKKSQSSERRYESKSKRASSERSISEKTERKAEAAEDKRSTRPKSSERKSESKSKESKRNRSTSSESFSEANRKAEVVEGKRSTRSPSKSAERRSGSKSNDSKRTSSDRSTEKREVGSQHVVSSRSKDSQHVISSRSKDSKNRSRSTEKKPTRDDRKRDSKDNHKSVAIVTTKNDRTDKKINSFHKHEDNKYSSRVSCKNSEKKGSGVRRKVVVLEEARDNCRSPTIAEIKASLRNTRISVEDHKTKTEASPEIITEEQVRVGTQLEVHPETVTEKIASENIQQLSRTESNPNPEECPGIRGINEATISEVADFLQSQHIEEAVIESVEDFVMADDHTTESPQTSQDLVEHAEETVTEPVEDFVIADHYINETEPPTTTAPDAGEPIEEPRPKPEDTNEVELARTAVPTEQCNFDETTSKPVSVDTTHNDTDQSSEETQHSIAEDLEQVEKVVEEQLTEETQHFVAEDLEPVEKVVEEQLTEETQHFVAEDLEPVEKVVEEQPSEGTQNLVSEDLEQVEKVVEEQPSEGTQHSIAEGLEQVEKVVKEQPSEETQHFVAEDLKPVEKVVEEQLTEETQHFVAEELEPVEKVVEEQLTEETQHFVAEDLKPVEKVVEEQLTEQTQHFVAEDLEQVEKVVEEQPSEVTQHLVAEDPEPVEKVVEEQLTEETQHFVAEDLEPVEKVVEEQPSEVTQHLVAEDPEPVEKVVEEQPSEGTQHLVAEDPEPVEKVVEEQPSEGTQHLVSEDLEQVEKVVEEQPSEVTQHLVAEDPEPVAKVVEEQPGEGTQHLVAEDPEPIEKVVEEQPSEGTQHLVAEDLEPVEKVVEEQPSEETQHLVSEDLEQVEKVVEEIPSEEKQHLVAENIENHHKILEESPSEEIQNLIAEGIGHRHDAKTVEERTSEETQNLIAEDIKDPHKILEERSSEDTQHLIPEDIEHNHEILEERSSEEMHHLVTEVIKHGEKTVEEFPPILVSQIPTVVNQNGPIEYNMSKEDSGKSGRNTPENTEMPHLMPEISSNNLEQCSENAKEIQSFAGERDQDDFSASAEPDAAKTHREAIVEDAKISNSSFEVSEDGQRSAETELEESEATTKTGKVEKHVETEQIKTVQDEVKIMLLSEVVQSEKEVEDGNGERQIVIENVPEPVPKPKTDILQELVTEFEIVTPAPSVHNSPKQHEEEPLIAEQAEVIVDKQQEKLPVTLSSEFPLPEPPEEVSLVHEKKSVHVEIPEVVVQNEVKKLRLEEPVPCINEDVASLIDKRRYSNVSEPEPLEPEEHEKRKRDIEDVSEVRPKRNKETGERYEIGSNFSDEETIMSLPDEVLCSAAKQKANLYESPQTLSGIFANHIDSNAAKYLSPAQVEVECGFVELGETFEPDPKLLEISSGIESAFKVFRTYGESYSRPYRMKESTSKNFEPPEPNIRLICPPETIELSKALHNNSIAPFSGQSTAGSLLETSNLLRLEDISHSKLRMGSNEGFDSIPDSHRTPSIPYDDVIDDACSKLASPNLDGSGDHTYTCNMGGPLLSGQGIAREEREILCRNDAPLPPNTPVDPMMLPQVDIMDDDLGFSDPSNLIEVDQLNIEYYDLKSKKEKPDLETSMPLVTPEPGPQVILDIHNKYAEEELYKLRQSNPPADLALPEQIIETEEHPCVTSSFSPVVPENIIETSHESDCSVSSFMMSNNYSSFIPDQKVVVENIEQCLYPNIKKDHITPPKQIQDVSVVSRKIPKSVKKTDNSNQLDLQILTQRKNVKTAVKPGPRRTPTQQSPLKIPIIKSPEILTFDVKPKSPNRKSQRDMNDILPVSEFGSPEGFKIRVKTNADLMMPTATSITGSENSLPKLSPQAFPKEEKLLVVPKDKPEPRRTRFDASGKDYIMENILNVATKQSHEKKSDEKTVDATKIPEANNKRKSDTPPNNDDNNKRAKKEDVPEDLFDKLKKAGPVNPHWTEEKKYPSAKDMGRVREAHGVPNRSRDKPYSQSVPSSRNHEGNHHMDRRREGYRDREREHYLRSASSYVSTQRLSRRPPSPADYRRSQRVMPDLRAIKSDHHASDHHTSIYAHTRKTFPIMRGGWAAVDKSKNVPHAENTSKPPEHDKSWIEKFEVNLGGSYTSKPVFGPPGSSSTTP